MKIGKLLPKSIYEPVSLWRKYKRNVQRDQWLMNEHSVELDEEILSDLRVVPNRDVLLGQLPKHSVGAEVGVAEGRFSRKILDIVQPRLLHLIDLWPEGSKRYGHSMHAALGRVANEVRAGTVEVHRGYSWDQIVELADCSLDWIYLDAAHDYNSVKADLEAALPKLVSGGWILGHDYTRWSSTGVNRFGVVEAVNEFCLNHRWKIQYLTHEADRHVSYALREISRSRPR